MKPIKFPESNVTFGQYQGEYIALPALRVENKEGAVISCWKLSFFERLKILITGRLWLNQMTFGDHLQPILPTANKLDLILPKGVRALTSENYIFTRMRVRVQEGYLMVYDRYTLQYRIKILGRYFWVTGEELLHLPPEKEELFPAYVFQILMQNRIKNSWKRSAEKRERIAFERRYVREMYFNELNSLY